MKFRTKIFSLLIFLLIAIVLLVFFHLNDMEAHVFVVALIYLFSMMFYQIGEYIGRDEEREFQQKLSQSEGSE